MTVLLAVVVVAGLVTTVMWLRRPSSRWGLAAVLLAVAPLLLIHAGAWAIKIMSWGSDYQGKPKEYQADLDDVLVVAVDVGAIGLFALLMVVAAVRLVRGRDGLSLVSLGVAFVGLAQVASLRWLLPSPDAAGFDVEDGVAFGEPSRAIDVATGAAWRSLGLAVAAGIACVIVARWAGRQGRGGAHVDTTSNPRARATPI